MNMSPGFVQNNSMNSCNFTLLCTFPPLPPPTVCIQLNTDVNVFVPFVNMSVFIVDYSPCVCVQSTLVG